MLLSKSEPRLDARHEAFLYQMQAAEAVRDLEYAALFHEQGLGKTKIGVDVALSWLKREIVDSVLIVTKRSLIANWASEIATHTFFEARQLSQDRSANFFAFNSPARLYLAHYEILKSEEKRLRLFQKTRKLGVILDEAHKIKNPDADLTKAVQALSSGFVRRVIMTGTPIANRPYDIWSQIRFLDGGASLGESFQEFRAGLDLSNDLAEDRRARDIFEERLTAIFRKIESFTVRETKASAAIELPEKSVANVTVEMEAKQKALYERFRIELSADIVKDGVPVVDDAEAVLKRLLRLVQVASNPALVDESYSGTPGKLSEAERLIASAAALGEKTIVWTSFVDNAEWLSQKLSRFGSVVVHGALTMDQRNRAIETFKHDPEVLVLIATPGAAKEGLTLTVANHAIFFDRSFALDDYLQAQDRIHRISQSRRCFVWNLIAADSVDEWVDMLLAAKHLAAQLAQGDIDQVEYAEKANYDFGLILRRILGVDVGRDDV